MRTYQVDEKIIDLIAVKEIYAVYQEDNGEEWWQPVLFAALVEAEGRYIRFVTMDEDGLQQYPEEVTSFLRYETGGKYQMPKVTLFP